MLFALLCLQYGLEAVLKIAVPAIFANEWEYNSGANCGAVKEIEISGIIVMAASDSLGWMKLETETRVGLLMS